MKADTLLLPVFTCQLSILEGFTQWSDNPTINNAISIDTNRQNSCRIVSDVIGGAIIAWDDYRNTATNSTDIYAQRVSGNGTLGLETGRSEEKISLPAGFTLNQNYPNPFITETRISFKLAMSGFVSLKVFNIEGKEVSTLVNEEMEPGSYTVMFDATGLPGGVYYYCLKTGDENDTRSMVLLK